MFSKFARSIKSIAKGPRAVLAESIARVLSEHFVLDPTDIESSLLKDARIVLKNTQLRAKRYRSDVVPNTVVSVTGVVEEVVFSWRWSFSGGSSSSSAEGSSSYASGKGMVQDVVLAIRGIKVQIVLDAWGNLNETEQALVETMESSLVNTEDITSSDLASVKEKEGFVQKYVQQVVDHLTLKLEDFEFTLQAKGGPSVIITGKDLELGTLASAKMTDGNGVTTKKLSQRISIGSFFVNVRDGESNKLFPLIEQFRYAASVTRLSGQRFQGGILSGLRVVGLLEEDAISASEEETKTDEGILFHIGLPQIQALSAIGVMLVPSGANSAEFTSPDNLNANGDSQPTLDDLEEAGQSTIFDLPLPVLTIVLPHSPQYAMLSKITLPRATVSYSTDGKLFRIESREGIKDNGKSIVTLAKGGKWNIDLVKKVFNLDKDGGGCKVCISNESLKRISSSIASLSSTEGITNLKDAWEGAESVHTEKTHETASEPWSILTGSVSLHLIGGDDKWLEANVAHSSFDLSPMMTEIIRANVGEFTVRSSFDNASTITAPSFMLHSGMVHISDTIETAFDSIDQALMMKDFLFSFRDSFDQSNESNPIKSAKSITTKLEFPCTVKLDQVKFIVRESNMNVQLKRLHCEGNSISCEDMICTADGSKAKAHNIQLKYLDSDIRMNIKTISSLNIPGVIVLKEPIVDTSIIYTSSGMTVSMNKVRGTFERPKSQQKSNDTEDLNISLPFAIKLNMNDLILNEVGADILIGVKDLSVTATAVDSIFALESCEGMKIRLQQSPDVFLDATMGNLSIQLLQENGNLRPLQIYLSEAQLGPCSPSCGKISIVVPPLFQEDGKTILFERNMNVSFDSLNVFEKLRPLFESIVGSQNDDPFDTFPFPITIPGMSISSLEPRSQVVVSTISAIDSHFIVGEVRANVQDTVSFSTKGVKVDIASRTLNAALVTSFMVPSILGLSKELENVNVTLDRDVLHVKIPTTTHVSLLSKSKGTLQKTPPAQQNEISIPFGVKVRMSKVILKTLRKTDTKCLEMEQISADVLPKTMPAKDVFDVEQKMTQISLEVKNIHHELFQIQKIRTSMMLQLHDLDTLHQLQVSLDSPRITAGYSATDWSSIYTDPEHNVQQKALKLPFAYVADTNIFISLDGTVVGSNATIALPEFKGDSFTTSDDLTSFYSSAILQHTPGFLTNLNVLGVNALDGSLTAAGKLAFGATNVATAGVGSVVGTAVADGVRGAIRAGKESRNVQTNDAYKFGDITRGIARGINGARKKGAQSRGSDGSDYIPGDLTIGAMESLGEYGSNNSRKLASSGITGAAATVGLLALGPVGMIAGGLLGSQVMGKGDSNEQQQPSQYQAEDSAGVQHQRRQQREQQQQQKPNQSNRNPSQYQQQHPRQHSQQAQHYHQTSSDPGTQSHQYQQPQPRLQAQQYQHQQQQYQQQQHYQSRGQPPAQQQQGFIGRQVARGKQASGRSEKSGYKFGKSISDKCPHERNFLFF